MILAFSTALALAQQCAPGIAPEAIMSIVTVESRLDPLAINVNHVGRLRAKSEDEAVELAIRWITAGYSVDVGLAQVNSRNLGWTGLSIASAFEPCANLTAADKILELAYARASREASGLDAISRTFSLYNTGDTASGFRNNYVARVWRAAEDVVPQIRDASSSAAATSPAPAGEEHGTTPPPVPTFVVGRTDPSVLTFR
jgi:type IV secretion system protein VirB1